MDRIDNKSAHGHGQNPNGMLYAMGRWQVARFLDVFIIMIDIDSLHFDALA